jgi:deazaflavin-dependent oxidoreductase (nitroreductase family)
VVNADTALQGRTMSEHKLPPCTPTQERVGNVAIRILSALNIWAYRISGGKIGGCFLRGAPVCLVTTTGRRSGQPRTAPLLYLADGDRVVLVASKGGMSKHPVWYLNLVANSRCTVEIGREKREMQANTASAEEKAALWPRLVAMYRDYDDYQSRSDREIPVVVLDPAA